MAFLFGDVDSDGWMFVDAINYQKNPNGTGHFVETKDIPKYPEGGFGVGWKMYFHPESKKFEFREKKIPYTEAEAMLKVAEAILDLAQAVREK